MSRAALIAAGIYLAFALFVVLTEEFSSGGGGWISLKHMGAFLVTFPVSMPLSVIGMEPNLDNKFVLALLLAACTGMVYQVVALIARVFTSR